MLDLAKPGSFLITTYRENCSNDFGGETNAKPGATIAPLRQELLHGVLQCTCILREVRLGGRSNFWDACLT